MSDPLPLAKRAAGGRSQTKFSEGECMVNVGFVVNAVVFAFLGVIIFWVSFLVIDKLTPYHLWKEIVDEHNFALAIVVGAMSLGICIIIAAAIHA